MQGKSFSTCIVLDNGQYSIKAGVNGFEGPTDTIPNIIGDPLHDGAFGTEEFRKDQKIGSDIKDPSLYKISRPLDKGSVQDWDMMSKVWHYLFFNQLRMQPDENAVLLTETILSPKRNREKAAEILFEAFNVPAL